MAMTLLGTLLDFPNPTRYPVGAFSVVNHQINATGEKCAIIFPLPKSGSITKLGFRVDGAATPETLRVSLQTLGTNGHPSGTLFGGSAAGTQASPAASTAYTVTLGTPATVAAGDVGDLVAIVIEFDSAIGDVRITAFIPGVSIKIPQGEAYLTSWIFSTNIITTWVEYSDGSYEDCFIPPFSSTNHNIFHLNTVGADEYGMAIQSAVAMRAVGIWAFASQNTVSADFEAILYSGTTPLKTVTADGDAHLLVSSFENKLSRFLFESPQDLAAATEYIVALRPTTTNSIQLRYVDFPSTAAMAAFGGANLYQKSRLDQGAWGSTTTRRSVMGLIIDAVDVSAGGGGETATGGRFNRGFN